MQCSSSNVVIETDLADEAHLRYSRKVSQPIFEGGVLFFPAM